MLDEIFGSLDEDRRTAVVELLRSLADRFPQVILITHIDSVRDGFDRVVRVGYDMARGVSGVDAQAPALRAVALELERAAGSHREGRGLSLEEFLRRTARRKLEELSGTRPVVEIELVRLET